MDSVVPQRLLEYRRRAGLSQEEAAFRIGATQGTLSRWERGATEPSFSDLAALAKAYGVRRAYFFMDEEELAAVEFAELVIARARLDLAATGTEGLRFRQTREHEVGVNNGQAVPTTEDYQVYAITHGIVLTGGIAHTGQNSHHPFTDSGMTPGHSPVDRDSEQIMVLAAAR